MEIDKSSQAQNDESSNYWLKKAETGSVPDFLLRYGVCNILHKLANTDLAPGGNKYVEVEEFIKRYMRSCDEIAINTEAANSQHYGLPPEFFELCLGDHLKYSCGYWQELEFYEVSEAPSSSILRDVITGTSSMTREFEKNRSIRQLLTQAEVNMLRVSLARAEVREKQNVLDLGCGWGSASLYILENYSHVKVVAVSNSKSQGDYIRKQALDKRVSDRLLVITCNVAEFNSSTYSKQIKEFMGNTKFDRIFSLEMFEHIRNWEKLLNKLAEEWLTEEGKIFLHFFANKSRPYIYDSSTWMGKNFFTGGMMPSHDLIKKLNNTIGGTLEIEAEYKVNGRHYSKTAEAWLKLLYQESRKILRIMQQVYGKEEGKIWFNRWKIFFLTLGEFFGMREGTEWFVSHYLLRRPKPKEENPKEENIETK